MGMNGMNRAGWLTAVGMMLLLLVTGCTDPDGRDGPDPTPGKKESGKKTVQQEWVIKWKEKKVDPAFLHTVDVLHRRENGGGISMLVRLKGGVKEDEWLDRWSSHVNVEFIHPNQKYEVEKEKHRDGGAQGGLYYINQIRADEAWRKVPLPIKKTESDQSVTVAVVDTGIDLDHPALVPYLVEGVNLKDSSLPPEDKMGHGTHVAGVVAEVWKGWEGKGELTGLHLMPVKVMSDGSDGDVYYTSEGIREAVRRGARVIVLAQGSWTYSEAMADAVAYAEEHGVVVVGAAGNASVNREGEILYNSPIYYPAAFPTVIGVGSVGPAGKVVPTSNWGTGIDVVAPGEGIRAAILDGKFGKDSGTSFATPQVGALAALILRKDPNQNPAQVRNLIRQTARPEKGHRWNQQYGYGLIDVHRALTEKPRKDIHEPNDREAEAAPFPMNQVVEGVLDGAGDRDCFEVEVSYSGMLTLTLKGAGKKNPELTAEITAADQKRVRYEGKQAEQIRVTVPHGSVIACYSTAGDRSWEYTLENRYRPQPDEYENNDHQWNAFNIKVKSGYSVFRGTLHKRRDYDWYRLDIPDEGTLTLRVDIWSPRGDPVMFIQREGSWKGRKVDQGAEGKAEEYRMKVKQESVYVRVSDYGTNPIDDPYNLIVRFEPKNGDAEEAHRTPSRAAPLHPGTTAERMDGEADPDWYILFLPQKEKATIQIRIPRGAEDATWWLYDENLRVLEEKHLSKGRKQSDLGSELAPGTYYLRVRGGDADAGKSYRLKVTLGSS